MAAGDPRRLGDPMSRNDNINDVSQMCFEDALAELELIVRRLEEGAGKLEEAILAYERGIALQRHCDAKLQEAQSRVRSHRAGPQRRGHVGAHQLRVRAAVLEIKAALAQNARDVDDLLGQLLPSRHDPESRLIEAVRYATLSGGKRIRPFLVMSSAALFGVSKPFALRVAAAIEMVHCYSLIHDDLPAMDNDDLRRGLPTCHVKFGEATAILAGDALLARAFEVLAEPATHPDPRVRSDLVGELAKAAGSDGMVGGQMLDLLAAHVRLEMPEITRMQRMKTGALIAFSCEAGALLGKAGDSARHALHAYAHDLGLAFQIVDDLLDVEGNDDEVGKRTRKDQGAGKATFVSLLGVDRARAQSDMLAQQAVQHLDVFNDTAEPLRALAAFVVSRRH